MGPLFRRSHSPLGRLLGQNARDLTKNEAETRPDNAGADWSNRQHVVCFRFRGPTGRKQWTPDWTGGQVDTGQVSGQVSGQLVQPVP